MYKIIFRTFLLLVLVNGSLTTSRAQSNANEAKAAYLLAEESYSKGDYKGAMDYLQQVKTSLGTTNCKILYLEIMVARELYPKDLAGTEKILALIDAFEKSPDYTAFNEEKSLEISKVKLVLKSGHKALKEKADSAAAKKAVLEKQFNEEFNRFGPLGVTFEQLDSLRPDLKLSEWTLYPKSTTHFPSWVDIDIDVPAKAYPFCEITIDSFQNKISSIAFRRDSGKGLVQYRSVLAYADKNINRKSFSETVLEVERIIESYGRKLGTAPSKEERVLKDGGKETWYQWELDGKMINLYKLSYPDGKTRVIKLMEVLFQL